MAYGAVSEMIICADVSTWALEYRRRIEAGEAKPISCWLTDPPYGLGDPPPMEELLRAWLAGESYDTGDGFMGANWDIVPAPHIWRAFLEISYPGAWLFAFGGTRTVDLLCLSLRIAGWIKRDEITHFLYGQGFPKSHNISKALDAEAGAERQIIDTRKQSGAKFKLTQELIDNGGFNDPDRTEFDITAPTTHYAKLFDGYGTALKPAVEPIVIFQAPRQGHTFAELARLYGTGGLCVEAGRVSCNDKAVFPAGVVSETGSIYGGGKGLFEKRPRPADSNPLGRFPPNAAFSHNPPRPCPTCQGQGVISSDYLRREYGVELPDRVTCPGCGGERLVGGCRRVGRKRVAVPRGKHAVASGKGSKSMFDGGADRAPLGYADADGLETVDDFICEDSCAVRLLGEMSGERPSTGPYPHTTFKKDTNTVYGKGIGNTQGQLYSDKGTAARYYHNFSWDLDALEPLELSPFFYCAKASRGEREAGCDGRPRQFLATMGDGIGEREHNESEPSAWVGNNHPTVKPLALTKWLAGMLKPPDEFDPVLAIPFSGSGSDIIGATLAGWKRIEACDNVQEYVDISEARLAWWKRWMHNTQLTDPAAIRRLAKAAEEAVPDGQLTMFQELEEAAR